MSKITNDGLTRSGTGCFIGVPIWQLATVGFKGLTAHQHNIRLYSAIHVGTRWKMQDRRQNKNTDNYTTKRNPEKKQNNAKYSNTVV